jgi:DNA-binding transcriptional regulator YiaG
MYKSKKYTSEAMEALYDDVLSNYKIGAITEERLREYEEACLLPEYAAKIQAARAKKTAGSSTRPEHRVPLYASGSRN